MRGFSVALVFALFAAGQAEAQLNCPDGKVEKLTNITANWTGTVTAGRVISGVQIGYLDQPFTTWTSVASFPLQALKGRALTYAALELDATAAAGEIWTTALRYNGDGGGPTRGVNVNQLQAGIDYADSHFPDTDTGGGSVGFSKSALSAQYTWVLPQYLQPAVDGGWPQWSVVLLPLYTRGVTLSAHASLVAPKLHVYSCAAH